jgi:hypothetical protein
MQEASRHGEEVDRAVWRLGQLPQSALRMDSVHAKKFTRERMPRQIGVDDYPLHDFGPPPGPYPAYEMRGPD